MNRILLDTSVIIDLADVELGSPRVRGTGGERMAAVVRRAGRNSRPRRMDLQIAATAAAHSIPLATRATSMVSPDWSGSSKLSWSERPPGACGISTGR